MTQVVTSNAALSLIKILTNTIHDKVHKKTIKKEVLKVLQALQKGNVICEQDGHQVEVSVDATTANELGLTVVVDGKHFHKFTKFVELDPVKSQGSFLTVLFSDIMTEATTYIDAARLAHSCRYFLMAAECVHYLPRYALPYTNQPLEAA